MEIKRVVVGPILTNCYLLIGADEMVVVDPGGEAEKLIKEIKKADKKLKYIINTHYHFDHTLANKDLKKEFNAKILIHQNEKDYIKHYISGFSLYLGEVPADKKAQAVVDFEPDQFLRDGDLIKFNSAKLKVIHTPGHSPGGICLLGDGFILTGDTLFKDGCGRVDIPGSNSEAMSKSLITLKKIIKTGMSVYPGHGEIYRSL